MRGGHNRIALRHNIFRFYPSQAKAIAESIVVEELRDQEYEEEDAKAWSLSIADKIREAIKSIEQRKSYFHHIILIVAKLTLPRYKIIVQATVGQLKDQGIRIASRCLWDVGTDNYTSVSYTNVCLMFIVFLLPDISTANSVLQCFDFRSIHRLRR